MGSSYRYAAREDGRTVRAHTLVWEAAHGPVPPGMMLDHMDRDRSNNALSNLRLVTSRQNSFNTVGRSSLGKGVTFRKGRYRVQVKAGSTTMDKTFQDLEEAQAFAAATRADLHGEFACDISA